MDYFIGIDLGTTNIKAIALDEMGVLLATASRASDTLHPEPDRSEQDPEQIWSSFLEVLQAVFQTCKDQGRIKGIAFSAAMHSVIAVDVVGKPLTNAWIWSDMRAQQLVQQMQGTTLANLLWNTTGTPIHPMSPFFKIWWMKENMPDVIAKTHKLIGIKEYIWHKLFNEYVCDYSIASATGLLDIKSLAWSDLALQNCGCTAAHLPDLVPATHYIRLTRNNAQQTGLPEGTPMVIGASDGALANLGVGDDGKALVMTIGTSAALRAFATQPDFTSIPPNFCYLLEPRKYIIGGASNNGGNILEWMRSVMFESTEDMVAFVNRANEIQAGSEGLFFLPYIHGERAPHWDATLRGSFWGIKPWHTKAHFIRAAMEGIVFNLKMIGENLQSHATYDKVMVSGGFTKNQLWISMVANIFGLPVMVSDNQVGDASALGAIKLCAKALNTPFNGNISNDRIIEVNAEEERFYRNAYNTFKEKRIM